MKTQNIFHKVLGTICFYALNQKYLLILINIQHLHTHLHIYMYI